MSPCTLVILGFATCPIFWITSKMCFLSVKHRLAASLVEEDLGQEGWQWNGLSFSTKLLVFWLPQTNNVEKH